MQFLLSWMEPHLDPWFEKPIHPLAPKEMLPDAYHDVREVTLAQEEPGQPEPDGPYRKVAESILSYEIFGSKIGIPITRTGKVVVGDTIGLRYHFLPGLSLFFASRVVEVFEDEETEDGWRSGFVYQTLESHPEVGEEIFEVTKLKSGVVKFRIEAWSQPNLWFVKLLKPWARRIQKHAAQCAVDFLGRVAGSAATN